MILFDKLYVLNYPFDELKLANIYEHCKMIT